MQAPLYLSAERYVPPRPVPVEITVDTVSLAELLAWPEIKAELYKVPGFQTAVEVSQAKDHLDHFQLRGFAGVDDALLQRVDAQIRRLGLKDLP